MQVYGVLQGDKICFTDYNKFKISSFLIPSANPLNDDDPLANKQWIKLTKEIDELQAGESLDFGEHAVVVVEIDDNVFAELMVNDVERML